LRDCFLAELGRPDIQAKSFLEKGLGVLYRNFAEPRNFIVANGFEKVIAPENDRVSKESP
jgi:hypothetical protein